MISSMHIDTKHHLEKTAIELEQSERHHAQPSYPWFDRKAAGAFRRAAKIVRKALEEA